VQAECVRLKKYAEGASNFVSPEINNDPELLGTVQFLPKSHIFCVILLLKNHECSVSAPSDQLFRFVDCLQVAKIGPCDNSSGRNVVILRHAECSKIK